MGTPMDLKNWGIKQYESALRRAVAFLRKKWGPPPDLAVVFGSGLGKAFLKSEKGGRVLAFEKVPHFGRLSVAGHPGKLVFYPSLESRSRSVLVMQGRRHFYEGIDPADLILPYRTLALWGIKRLLLTNASGALKKGIKPGDLVLIGDHINLMGFNPLRGANLAHLGPRFPSLHRLYKGPLAREIRRAARSCRVSLGTGIYVGLAGPSYETPAEIRAFRKFGGDLVGMSTVPEAIAAAHAGMDVAALSAIANTAESAGLGLRHQDVLAQVQRADVKMAKILSRLVRGASSQ